MGLNDIRLPAGLIVDLYKNSLIETGEETVIDQPVVVAETKAGETEWKCLGNNRKNILVIVNSDNAVYLPDNELELLTSMLTACKLSLDDVAIMNQCNHPEASYKKLIDFFRSKIVLLFGVEPASFGLPINFPHFQLQAFANNTFLYSPSLKDLENDKVIKSKLWVCLKRLFNL